MYDILIANGTLVDGTGPVPVGGDVAVSNGRIVAPGWVDVHTPQQEYTRALLGAVGPVIGADK